MNITEAIEFVKSHHLSALKHSTSMGYSLFFNNLKAYFEGRVVETITFDDIGHFLDSTAVKYHLQLVENARLTRRRWRVAV